jgi:hypothetical protein
MSDTDEWEKSVQQVLLPSEYSEDRTMMELPPKRKLTVSHVNKKLEDYHGEMKSEQQTLIEWVLQREKHDQEKGRRADEERLRREQFKSEERLRKQHRQAEKDRVADERAMQNEDNWKILKQWRAKESG